TWYLAPGEYVLVVKNGDAFNARYPGLGSLVAGEFDLGFSLANNGERLTLSTVTGHTIQTFEYKDGWFPQTDGEGFSLVIRDPAQDLTLWDAKDGWRASWLASGNPGAADTGLNPGSVVVNEIMSHQDIAEGDWIELHNTTAGPISVGGWYLSDDPHDLMKYRIAPGTTIAGGGYLVLTYRDNFGPAAPDAGRLTGFGFSEYGDDAYLTGSPAAGVLGGYREDEYFGAADNGVVFGRYIKSTGGKDFVSLAWPTPWDANGAPVVGPVFINEIMYNPPVGGYEYIELYNLTDAAVDLHDGESPQNTWQIAGGVTFTFPEGASIPTHGYALVVGIDPAVFRAAYGVPGSVAIYGPYTGVLDNAGETIGLYRPGVPDAGLVPQVLVEKVTYGDAAPWPTQPDGDGSSLNRLLPGAYGHYGNDVANWQAGTSGGSPGAANVPIDATPPSIPANLEAAAASETAIDLAWEAASDPDTGLFGYRIYRDGVAVGTSPTTLFTDYGVVAGVVYTYEVSALNGDRVESARSGAVTASILAVTSVSTPDQTHVKITFNAPVNKTSAETKANYKLIHGAGIVHTIASASLDAGGTVVTLTLSTPLVSGEVHALAVKGVVAQSGTPVAPGCQRTFRYWAAGTGTILRQWWLGIDGNEVSLLTGNPNYPNNPSGSDYPTSFEAPIDWAESYGTRMQGYVHPSQSGYYTFWIASDDSSQLWLSTDENPAHKAMVAYVSSWASSRQWSWYPSQQSAAIYLEAGQRYYVEALQKEGGSGDNLAVAWWFNYAGQPLDTLAPIPGAYLSPYTGAAAAVTVNVAATDAEAAEAGPDTGTFTITRTNTANTLTVYYTVTGRAASGDYTPTMTNWVLMNVGVGSVPIVITPVNDATPERDETVVLTLTASPLYSVGVGSATITILDNDQVTPPTVNIVATDASAAEAGQNPGTFTVSR
ncbi:MAG: lamin tail domain-containing protein, partial [Planctomycetes bacterium]|nr:lamin tail domain-containing protein [Planctomycetota bacterium]